MPKRALHKVAPPSSLLLWPSPRTPGVSIRRIALSCRLVFTVVGGTALAREEQPVDDGTGVEGVRALTEGGNQGDWERVCNKGGIETTPSHRRGTAVSHTVDKEIVPSHSSLLWIILFATERSEGAFLVFNSERASGL